MEVKRRGHSSQWLQAVDAVKRAKKVALEQDGLKTSITPVTRFKREPIQTRRKTLSEGRVLRSRLSIGAGNGTGVDAKTPANSKLIKKRKSKKQEEDYIDSDIEIIFDSSKKTAQRTVPKNNTMEYKKFAKAILFSTEPITHAFEMIRELRADHEDFQASVIVTNCKNKMEKRVRQRRNRERQGIEANKENTMEVDLPGNSGMERELYYDVSDGWEQYPIPIHCTSEEQLDKLFDSFKYIYKNEIQNGLPDLKDLIEPSNSNKILPEYKCGCDRNGGCGSKCPCVLASIAVGGAFIYYNHIIVGGSVDGWTSTVLGCGYRCACKGRCSNSGTNIFDSSCLELFNDKVKGWGVRVGRVGAESGRMLVPFVGEVISEEEHEKRQQLGSGDWTWLMYQKGKIDQVSAKLAAYYQRKYKPPENNIYIDPINRGNVGRFVNCSEIPNAAGLRLFVNDLRPEKTQYIFYATRPIAPGEEILVDYGDNYQGIKICRCGQELCPHDKKWQEPGSEKDYMNLLNNFNRHLWTSTITEQRLLRTIALQQIQDHRQLCLMLYLLKEQIQYMIRLGLKKLNISILKDRLAKISKGLNKVLNEAPKEDNEEDIIVLYTNITNIAGY